MSKNYLAYTFLTLAALFWSGNFIIGKFATLFEVPPLTLNFLRWVMVWFILIPFTIKEILAKKNYIKENFFVIGIMGILSISTFNSVVYFALNFFRWISVWLILIPFTYKEIFNNWNYIKKNLIVISFMGIMTISTFNSVVYFALNYTQVINVALVLAAIPAVTIIISSFMKVDKTNIFQLIGLLLSVIGISSIISNADINKILALNFNKGDLWMLVCVICWSLYSTLLKKYSFKFSQFTLIQLMVSVGILFLIPQFFYEKSIGLETNFNISFFIILFYVVMFPALAAYYCWQKGIEIVGPNRATMFIQLMPLLSAVLAILIFQETFELYHFIGASFILSGIYLSNKKTIK